MNPKGGSRWGLLCFSRSREILIATMLTTFRHRADLTTAPPRLPAILSLRRIGSLPLHIRDAIGSAAGERDDVILDVAGAGAGRAACRGAGVLPLKFVFDC